MRADAVGLRDVTAGPGDHEAQPSRGGRADARVVDLAGAAARLQRVPDVAGARRRRAEARLVRRQEIGCLARRAGRRRRRQRRPPVPTSARRPRRPLPLRLPGSLSSRGATSSRGYAHKCDIANMFQSIASRVAPQTLGGGSHVQQHLAGAAARDQLAQIGAELALGEDAARAGVQQIRDIARRHDRRRGRDRDRQFESVDLGRGRIPLPGIRTSSSTASGRCATTASTASSASRAVATTSNRPSAARESHTASSTSASSSATTIRIGTGAAPSARCQ